jgi:hypothetical protein
MEGKKPSMDVAVYIGLSAASFPISLRDGGNEGGREEGRKEAV